MHVHCSEIVDLIVDFNAASSRHCAYQIFWRWLQPLRTMAPTGTGNESCGLGPMIVVSFFFLLLAGSGVVATYSNIEPHKFDTCALCDSGAAMAGHWWHTQTETDQWVVTEFCGDPLEWMLYGMN